MRGRSGQIILPALFVFPSLILFVWLIFETAKLSKEKIRHQFAIDAAAFVEMTNYSDFLNRTAYVNGAFPMRIFDEGFGTYAVDCDKKTNNCKPTTMKELLYENGVFPKSPQSSGFDDMKQWNIRYGGKVGERKNPASPNDPPDLDETIEFLTWQNAHDYWINWDEAQSLYKLYVQIYQLLGSVEEAQYSVLQRLSSGHNFLQKSYWLNTGDSLADVQEAVSSFHASAAGFKAVPYCHKKIMFYGNKPTDDTFQGWQEWAPPKPIDAPYMQSCKDGPGLFQVMWVNPNEIKKMKAGYPVVQHWKAPKNYFNVDFNTGHRALDNGRPKVRATVTVGENSQAAVWPDPTPKFQVRLYP